VTITNPVFRLTPWVYLTMEQFLTAKTEVAARVLTHEDEPFIGCGLQVPQQECTAASWSFDDDELQKLDLAWAEEGTPNSQYDRIVIHTHPGTSSTPSSTDNTEFAEDKWAGKPYYVQLIIAKGSMFGRMRVNLTPQRYVVVPLTVRVDWSLLFGSNLTIGSDGHEQFIKDALACVTTRTFTQFKKQQKWSNGSGLLVPDKRIPLAPTPEHALFDKNEDTQWAEDFVAIYLKAIEAQDMPKIAQMVQVYADEVGKDPWIERTIEADIRIHAGMKQWVQEAINNAIEILSNPPAELLATPTEHTTPGGTKVVIGPSQKKARNLLKNRKKNRK